MNRIGFFFYLATEVFHSAVRGEGSVALRKNLGKDAILAKILAKQLRKAPGSAKGPSPVVYE